MYKKNTHTQKNSVLLLFCTVLLGTSSERPKALRIVVKHGRVVKKFDFYTAGVRLMFHQWAYGQDILKECYLVFYLVFCLSILIK